VPIRDLTAAERSEARSHGLSDEDIARQLEFYSTAPPFARLVRPCTANDGIRIVAESEAEGLAGRYREALADRSVVCFVPASGAASRMFKTPLQFLHSPRPVTRADLERDGSKDARELLEAVNGLRRFAFFAALAQAAKRIGFDVERFGAHDDLRPLLGALLTPQGLNYANLPKGLLAFHAYPDGVRTPFEEHLVEAASYGRDARGDCRLHFTVSHEHITGFRELASRVVDRYAAQTGVRYEVDFSTQHPSTDSFAVDMNGGVFHDADGSLLFRPGGHGSLQENLAAIDADVVYLKNIDNVVPDHLKGETFVWRRALGTILLDTQRRIFDATEALERGEHGAAETASALLAELGTRVAASDAGALTRMLDRPLRVCGMVANVGDPGGGPFWVRLDGRDTLQIVETSQVDPHDAAQQRVLSSATHFNPVDIVCGLRDRRGQRYELGRFVDRDSVFIVEKSKDGRPLRSLERPGLWNGAMARWNTIFVEVPYSTFNPVKTMNVLLSPAHQPAARSL
jgi:hypothetical protein